jgi:hypothetical protein
VSYRLRVIYYSKVRPEILVLKNRPLFQVKEDEMDSACSVNEDKKCILNIEGQARRNETTRKIKTQAGG